MWRDSGGFGKNRWRMRRIWNSYGENSGYTVGEAIFDQDVPGSRLFSKWQSSSLWRFYLYYLYSNMFTLDYILILVLITNKNWKF